MRRSSKCLPPLLWLVGIGCFDPEPVDVQGFITAVDARAVGEPPFIERSLFVDGGPDCSDRAKVFYTLETPIMKRVVGSNPIYVDADTSALAVGARVMVWTAAFTLTSCPPQKFATSIVVIP